MGDIISGVGSLAGAAGQLVEVPLKISEEVREWKKFQMELSQGGVDNKFAPQTNLVPDNAQIATQIRAAYELDEENFQVLVTDGDKVVPDSTLLGFRSVKSKNKFGIKVSWNYVSKRVYVKTKAEVDPGDGGAKIPAGTVLSDGPFGLFIDDVAITTIGATNHITKSGFNFVIAPAMEAKILQVDKKPVSRVHVTLTLSSSVANKKLTGAGKPMVFEYTIHGDTSIMAAFGEQGAAVTVP